MLLGVAVLGGLLTPAGASDEDNARAKIRDLEAQLAKKKGQFDWTLHNELRHYYGAVDRDREFYHINVILTHSFMDGYMMNILSGWQIGKDTARAIENLRQVARTRGKYPLVAAACWLKAGELESSLPKADPARARECFENALKVKGEDAAPYRHLARQWQENLAPPVGQAASLSK
jgi:hypothetical protein